MKKHYKRRPARRAKHRFKRRAKGYQAGRNLLSTGQSLRFQTSIFPPQFKTVMTTYMTNSLLSGNALVIYSYKLNSFGGGTGGGGGVGPSTNAGAFSGNYPMGLKTLLQTPLNTGAALGPYTNYRVLASRIYYRIIPGSVAAAAASSPEIRCVVFPSTQLDYTATPFINMVEQQGAKFSAMSTAYFGTATTTAISGGGQSLASVSQTPMFNNNYCTVSRLYGVKPNTIHEDNTFWGAYNANPVNIGYWQLVVAGDGTNNFACEIEVVVKSEVIWFNRNDNLSSAVNV